MNECSVCGIEIDDPEEGALCKECYAEEVKMMWADLAMDSERDDG